MSNVPKLRFKEFRGDWIEKKLKSILLDFRLGGNYSNSETINSKPLIKMGNLNRGNIVLNKIEYIADNENIDELDRIKYGDLFFNTRNTLDLVGKVAIWKNELPDAYYNSNLMWMKYENNFFMNYRFNTFQGIKALRRIATGTTSVAAIYTKDLLKISFNVPEGDEQEKIASFLASVDRKIEQLTKKEELLQQYKKGVMQKIFNQEIRFKADDGSEFCEWEENKLGDIGITYNGLTGKTSENFGSGKPYIQYKQIFDNSRITIDGFGYVSIEPNEKQNKVQFGDIFFTTSSETPNEVGFTSVLLDNVEEVYLNSFCFGYRAKSLDILNPYFAKFLFRSDNFRRKVIELAQGSTRYNISKLELMKTLIQLPCLEEQTKIANFLSAIDSKIEKVQKQLELSKEFKKALLQQMFI